jgi:hypothetical protein
MAGLGIPPSTKPGIKSSALDPGSTRTVKNNLTGADVSASTRTQRIPRRLSVGFTEYGYIAADGKSIPEEYLVRITSYKHNATIIAPLQEDIALRVESRWEPFIPTSMLARANILTQAVTSSERSFITQATSRRIWMGSSPMVISLRLRFEAVQDPFAEVVEPSRLLQSIAVPSDPSTNTSDSGEVGKSLQAGNYWDVVSKLPGLQPPGPTPFSWDNLLSGQKAYPTMSRSDVESSLRGGDFIMIEVGRFLTFWNVIVRENTVNFKVKFDPNGDPISSEVEVVFETYEMPTVEGLRKSYTKVSATEGSA